MTHKCHQTNCDHSSVKFCPHCQKCYCETCGKEWPEKECNRYPWWSVSYPEKPWPVTYTSDNAGNTIGSPPPKENIVLCEHHG